MADPRDFPAYGDISTFLHLRWVHEHEALAAAKPDVVIVGAPFDAHADTADASWGVSLSHGTPMRRLIEAGHVAGRNFVQVGLRGYWPPPDVLEWMREHEMRTHFMAEIERRGFDAVLADAIAEALDGPELIYLSLD